MEICPRLDDVLCRRPGAWGRSAPHVADLSAKPSRVNEAHGDDPSRATRHHRFNGQTTSIASGPTTNRQGPNRSQMHA
jgi:hypothetical protein